MRIVEKFYVHAVKKADYMLMDERENGVENPDEFRYEISACEKPWREDAVTIWEETISIDFPKVDCRKELICKLKEEKEKVLAESQRKLEDLDDQIRQLSALTYQND
jgi:hypothetical protein